MCAATVERMSSHATEGREFRHSPVLVAIDGGPASHGPLFAANAIAAARGADVRVISVLEALPSGVPEFGGVMPSAQLDRKCVATQDGLIRHMVRDTFDPLCSWTVDVRVGDPAQIIAAASNAMNANVVVMGTGGHGFTHRLFGTETSLYVARFAHCPVFSVPVDFEHMPRTAVLAVDFSDHSMRAVRVALALFPTLRTIHLVYSYSPLDSPSGEPEMHELERLRRELELPFEIHAVPVTIGDNNAAAAILRYAADMSADVIVAGSHGRGFFSRLVHGSVSSAILRGATNAVLIVPPPATAPHHALASHVSAEPVPSSAWSALLDDFTRRNLGRICSMEVDDPAFGAQCQVSHYAFLGVSHDRRDGRVVLMLGDNDTSRPHLTRCIPAVTAVHVATDRNDRDILHVAHGQGQTLLTFHN